MQPTKEKFVLPLESKTLQPHGQGSLMFAPEHLKRRSEERARLDLTTRMLSAHLTWLRGQVIGEAPADAGEAENSYRPLIVEEVRSAAARSHAFYALFSNLKEILDTGVSSLEEAFADIRKNVIAHPGERPLIGNDEKRHGVRDLLFKFLKHLGYADDRFETDADVLLLLSEVEALWSVQSQIHFSEVGLAEDVIRDTSPDELAIVAGSLEKASDNFALRLRWQEYNLFLRSISNAHFKDYVANEEYAESGVARKRQELIARRDTVALCEDMIAEVLAWNAHYGASLFGPRHSKLWKLDDAVLFALAGRVTTDTTAPATDATKVELDDKTKAILMELSPELYQSGDASLLKDKKDVTLEVLAAHLTELERQLNVAQHVEKVAVRSQQLREFLVRLVLAQMALETRATLRSLDPNGDPAALKMMLHARLKLRGITFDETYDRQDLFDKYLDYQTRAMYRQTKKANSKADALSLVLLAGFAIGCGMVCTALSYQILSNIGYIASSELLMLAVTAFAGLAILVVTAVNWNLAKSSIRKVVFGFVGDRNIPETSTPEIEHSTLPWVGRYINKFRTWVARSFPILDYHYEHLNRFSSEDLIEELMDAVILPMRKRRKDNKSDAEIVVGNLLICSEEEPGEEVLHGRVGRLNRFVIPKSVADLDNDEAFKKAVYAELRKLNRFQLADLLADQRLTGGTALAVKASIVIAILAALTFAALSFTAPLQPLMLLTGLIGISSDAAWVVAGFLALATFAVMGSLMFRQMVALSTGTLWKNVSTSCKNLWHLETQGFAQAATKWLTIGFLALIFPLVIFGVMMTMQASKAPLDTLFLGTLRLAAMLASILTFTTLAVTTGGDLPFALGAASKYVSDKATDAIEAAKAEQAGETALDELEPSTWQEKLAASWKSFKAKVYVHGKTVLQWWNAVYNIAPAVFGLMSAGLFFGAIPFAALGATWAIVACVVAAVAAVICSRTASGLWDQQPKWRNVQQELEQYGPEGSAYDAYNAETTKQLEWPEGAFMVKSVALTPVPVDTALSFKYSRSPAAEEGPAAAHAAAV